MGRCWESAPTVPTPAEKLSQAAGTVEFMDHAQMAVSVADPHVAERYWAKIVMVPGSECAWWSGAISGNGHGRFWLGGDRVVIAHRFGFALQRGVDALTQASMLSHGCDNPLCQLVHPEHVRPATASENRREWAARRHIAGLPLSDPRGSRRRAQTHRDLLRQDPALVRRDQDELVARTGRQMPLF